MIIEWELHARLNTDFQLEGKIISKKLIEKKIYNDSMHTIKPITR